MASSTATDATETDGRANSGLRAHALGHGKRSGKQQIQLGVDRSHGAGGSIGFLYLPQNLRLADHHRIEAGRHAKHMADRFVFAKFVEVRFKLG